MNIAGRTGDARTGLVLRRVHFAHRCVVAPRKFEELDVQVLCKRGVMNVK